MQIRTKRTFSTTVAFSDVRKVVVEAGGKIVSLSQPELPFQVIYLDPEDARFLADLLNEAADTVQENIGEGPEDSFPPTPTGSMGGTGGSTAYPYPRTTDTFKSFSASDVHGWSKNGTVRI